MTAERRFTGICVLGMHRSGTSLITKGMEILGANLGQRVADEPSADNVKGHWEDKDVVDINTELLRHFGLAWDSVDALPPGFEDHPEIAGLHERAVELIAGKEAFVSEGSVWCIKDPRCCVTLPFWQSVFSRIGISVGYLWIARHPDEVALSLARRNGFQRPISDWLWLRHNYAVCQHVPDDRSIVVRYADFLEAPRQELRRIASYFELHPHSRKDVQTYCDLFVDESLRHSESVAIPTRAYTLLEEALSAMWRDVESSLLTDQMEGGAKPSRLSERQLVDQVDLSNVWKELVDANIIPEPATSDENLRGAIVSRPRGEQPDASSGADIYEASLKNIETRLQVLEIESRAPSPELLSAMAEQLSGVLQLSVVEPVLRIEERLERDAIRDQDLSKIVQEVRAVANGARSGSDSDFEFLGVSDQASPFGDAIGELASHVRGLKEQLADAQIQSDIQTERAAGAEVEIDRLKQANAALMEALNAERFSVIKPVLRKSYRAGSTLYHRLPAQIQKPMQRVKRVVAPSPIVLHYEIPQPLSEQESLDELLLSKLVSTKSTFRDVIVYPVIDWNFRVQRPQHLAREFGESGERVIYLTTTFSRSDTPGFRVLENPAKDVFVVELAVNRNSFSIYEEPMDEPLLAGFTASMMKLIEIADVRNSIGVVDLPFWRPLALAVPGSFVVYDCMDFHEGFSTNHSSMLNEEKLLLRDADLVVTTADRLSEKIAVYRENTVIRNAGQVDFFAAKPESLAYVSERPVIGYLGAISDWYDIDLVTECARLLPDFDFVLVGATTGCDTKHAKSLANIRFVGEVPYESASSWVHSFDVALIPFKVVELTLCTNPVKVYEYLAAGKPVVSTKLPEVEAIGSLVYTAEGAAEFLKAIVSALNEEDPALPEIRSEWARDHDWTHRAMSFREAVVEAQPRVSVVVLTYNNLEYTKACLLSLEINSGYENLEIVIVDNSSSDGTQEYLLEYGKYRDDVCVILNEENYGFAKGNNIGLDAASGQLLVVLNNDTYVTPGWIHSMARHLRLDSDVGLVGPVTNNIGNEARIEIVYSNMSEMEQSAAAYTSKRPGQSLEVDCVAFFCTMMTRQVYQEIGGLDEAFGRGFFEDDDYCQRVRKAGYKVVIADDVFVHHHLSASFAKLDDGERRTLFETNKKIYEEKWGEWKPHKYRDPD